MLLNFLPVLPRCRILNPADFENGSRRREEAEKRVIPAKKSASSRLRLPAHAISKHVLIQQILKNRKRPAPNLLGLAFQQPVLVEPAGLAPITLAPK